MKRIFVFTSIALLLSILVTNTTFAAASAPTSASGTLTTTSASFDSVRVEGGNMIIDLSSTVAYTGTFNLDGSNDPTGAFKATQTIVSATGNLAGLRGVLSQVGAIGPGGPAGTYSGQIQFGNP